MPQEIHPLPAPRVTDQWSHPWARMVICQVDSTRDLHNSTITSQLILCGVPEVQRPCIRNNNTINNNSSNNSMAFPHPLTTFTDPMIGFILAVSNLLF